MMFGRKGNGGRRGAVLWVADAVSMVLSCLVAAALLLSYAAPHVDPDSVLWFAFLGMAAPFLWVADVVLMLYWVLRWKPVSLVLAVAALAGAGHVTKFYRPSPGRVYSEQKRETGTLRVMSYNVEGFFGNDSLGQRGNQMDAVTAFIREVDPDIVCLQEFEINHVNPFGRFEDSLPEWKYKALFLRNDDVSAGGLGLAVYSKYPLMRRGGIRYPDSNNASMWVDVAVRRDTIRLYNNHMQSTQVDRSDREYLGTMKVLTDSLGEDRTRSILHKLGRNFKVRAAQADSVAEKIHDGTPRVIVCGDFNDTPMSYTYRRMRGDLTDAFSRKGRGAVYTYRGLLGIFRIDYLFHSDDFETVDYLSERPQWSDHYPVIVDLKLKEHGQ